MYVCMYVYILCVYILYTIEFTLVHSPQTHIYMYCTSHYKCGLFEANQGHHFIKDSIVAILHIQNSIILIQTTEYNNCMLE